MDKYFAAVYLEVRGPKFSHRRVSEASPRIDNDNVDKNVDKVIDKNVDKVIDKNVDTDLRKFILLPTKSPRSILEARKLPNCIATLGRRFQ